MRIIAWILYALAALSAWTGLAYVLRRDWLQMGLAVALAMMCWISAGVLLEEWL